MSRVRDDEEQDLRTALLDELFEIPSPRDEEWMFVATARDDRNPWTEGSTAPPCCPGTQSGCY